jgi:TonB family protein
LLDGVVVLEAIITEKGHIGDLVIVKPAGAGFDENAVEAGSQWKYTAYGELRVQPLDPGPPSSSGRRFSMRSVKRLHSRCP